MVPSPRGLNGQQRSSAQVCFQGAPLGGVEVVVAVLAALTLTAWVPRDSSPVWVKGGGGGSFDLSQPH